MGLNAARRRFVKPCVIACISNSLEITIYADRLLRGPLNFMGMANRVGGGVGHWFCDRKFLSFQYINPPSSGQWRAEWASLSV